MKLQNLGNSWEWNDSFLDPGNSRQFLRVGKGKSQITKIDKLLTNKSPEISKKFQEFSGIFRN